MKMILATQAVRKVAMENAADDESAMM